MKQLTIVETTSISGATVTMDGISITVAEQSVSPACAHYVENVVMEQIVYVASGWISTEVATENVITQTCYHSSSPCSPVDAMVALGSLYIS